MIQFTCPGCQSTMSLPDTFVGRKARCCSCSATFSVPNQLDDSQTSRPSLLPTVLHARRAARIDGVKDRYTVRIEGDRISFEGRSNPNHRVTLSRDRAREYIRPYMLGFRVQLPHEKRSLVAFKAKHPRDVHIANACLKQWLTNGDEVDFCTSVFNAAERRAFHEPALLAVLMSSITAAVLVVLMVGQEMIVRHYSETTLLWVGIPLALILVSLVGMLRRQAWALVLAAVLCGTMALDALASILYYQVLDGDKFQQLNTAGIVVLLVRSGFMVIFMMALITGYRHVSHIRQVAQLFRGP